MEESMETRIIKKERLEGLWSCLPEEVICTFYEYLSFRDVEAASQTCRSWYAAFINSSKIHNNVEFVIHRNHSEALAALSRYPSRCKRITIEGSSYRLSGPRMSKKGSF
ncbi:F-box and leucine-rich repeat protein 13-like [Artemia franciscana]|uniref:F-box and leucine-rich repeat protein 13-like n=1 Tax=Artemia franciscana TaxID=6661 RepID=UPI0032DB1115